MTKPHQYLSGQQFGSWTAMSYAGKSKWECKCDCGTVALVATNHLKSGNSTRCLECKRKHCNNLLSVNHNQFIERAMVAHDNKYDYSRTQYVSSRFRVEIICPIHGIYTQTPKNHLRGKGCYECGNNSIRDNFTVRVKEIHKDKYDYSMVDLETIRHHDNIKVICPNHGVFNINANDHLRGAGCKNCTLDQRRLSNDEFIIRSSVAHKGKYDYSKTSYGNNGLAKVVVTCPEHGDFRVRPDQHLYVGAGCPRCQTVISKPHQMVIDLLIKASLIEGVDFEVNDRSITPPYELDIWIPKHQLGIEIHGNYWHAVRRGLLTSEINSAKKKCSRKADAASAEGVQLLQFWDFQIQSNLELVKSMVYHKLGKSEKIYARNCEIETLKNKDVRSFFDGNHLYGHRNASLILVLTHRGKICSALSFVAHPKYQWEIARFATNKNTIVVGGFSKLFKAFLNCTSANSVLTFADRMISTGEVYKKMGFRLEAVTKPNYFYRLKDENFSRQKCQKHRLPKFLGAGFNPNISESQNMLKAGYLQLHDAGHCKFIWHRLV